MIALIPFRKGSKRVPEKNIKMFNRNGAARTLFMHTVLQALKCGNIFESVVVSTDYSLAFLFSIDEYVMDKCVIHVRNEVADDQPASHYIKEFIDSQKFGNASDICLLQPTCPLRSHIDIYGAVDKYYTQKDEKPTLVSVTKVGPNKKLYVNGITGFGSISSDNILACDEEGKKAEEIYVRNSSIYIFNVGYFRKNNTIFDNKPNYYQMPVSRSIDINTEEDFKMAEALSKVCDIE
jgi:CMP-N-acetylneuraminic acid synthetase